VVVVDPARFAPEATLVARVWDGEQLLTLERNSRCATVHDPRTGRSQIRCPEGIEYREVVPHEFRYPVRSMGSRLELRAARVRVGTDFRLRVSGPSPDGCNTTSADFTGAARSERVLLDSLDWETTLRACVASPARP
jgi:hypothetical protein